MAGVFQSILGGIIVLILLRLFKISLPISLKILESAKNLIDEYNNSVEKKIDIAKQRARYRDLFIYRSIVISIYNFALSALYAAGGLVWWIISEKFNFHYYIGPILYSTLFIFSVIVFFIGLRILSKANEVVTTWMLQLEEKNG